MTAHTHLYDPLDPVYYDPEDARAERDRTFQICSDCRICVRFCPSFKDLFRFIDADESADDVSVLTDAEHKQVVDECYQCKLCYIVCPYTPDQEQEWKIDFPRLMLRSLAIQGKAKQVQKGARLLARTDLQGKVATSMAGMVNGTNRFKPVRFLMEKTTGISRDRLLPDFAKERFSKWFGKRRGCGGRGAGDRRALPDVPGGVPATRDRQGHGRGVRAQRHRVRAARGAGVLRHAVARCRRRRQVRGAREDQRRRARRRRAQRA